MKYLLFLLMLGGTAMAQKRGDSVRANPNFITVKYCPISKDHKHHFDDLEKCNQPTCGAFCECGAKKLYASGKIILPVNACQRFKDSTSKYNVLLARAMVAKEQIKDGNGIDSLNNVISIYQKKRLFYQTKAQRCAGGL